MADREGGGSRGRMNLAGSTATWNPERGYPELGDSLPCPAPGEDEAYTLRTATVGELLRLIYECPAELQCGPCRRRIGELARRADFAAATAHQRDMKLEWKARCEAAEARLKTAEDALGEEKHEAAMNLDGLVTFRNAIHAMMNELGVPGVGYPAPVANAHEIGREALSGCDAKAVEEPLAGSPDLNHTT